MTYWNDIEILSKVARALPYILILAGFLVAASGQFFKGIVESRISELQTTASHAHKNTKPLVKGFLAHSATSGKKLLVMDAENEIPFKASWFVVTHNDVVVSPIMLRQQEIHPTETKRRFSSTIVINSEKVVDNYIELRFSYESVYSDELNNPAHLRGGNREAYAYVNEQILHRLDPTLETQ